MYLIITTTTSDEMKRLEHKEWLRDGIYPIVELGDEYDIEYFYIEMFKNDDNEYIARAYNPPTNSGICDHIAESEPWYTIDGVLERIVELLESYVTEEAENL